MVIITNLLAVIEEQGQDWQEKAPDGSASNVPSIHLSHEIPVVPFLQF